MCTIVAHKNTKAAYVQQTMIVVCTCGVIPRRTNPQGELLSIQKSVRNWRWLKCVHVCNELDRK